jgi:pilus assembly protein CpaF
MNIKLAQEIERKIQQIPSQDLSYGVLDETKSRDFKIRSLIDDSVNSLESDSSNRIREEFLGMGPISVLLADEEITEILILSHNRICFEKYGQLHALNDYFCSIHTFKNFVDRVCTEARTHFNLERPMTNGKFRDFRLHLISSELTHDSHAIALRRHPKNPWTLEKLLEQGWCKKEDLEIIEKILFSKGNFIVVGGTGSGKTSFLNACLQKIPGRERIVIIEDTPELTVPNLFSSKLVTRFDANGILPPIDQSELVRQSLRMRPDRLVMGEIRGAEAKDLLMALSTGHDGSFGTLHANSPSQALIRLEMLIQLGAPGWSLSAIRQLIKLSLQYVFVIGKSPEGHRRLQGLYQITSIEEIGLLLERLL